MAPGEGVLALSDVPIRFLVNIPPTISQFTHPTPEQEVDRHLGEVCSRVHDALPPRLAKAVLQALVIALQQVLLDGGPYRCEAVL